MKTGTTKPVNTESDGCLDHDYLDYIDDRTATSPTSTPSPTFLFFVYFPYGPKIPALPRRSPLSGVEHEDPLHTCAPKPKPLYICPIFYNLTSIL